MSGHPDLIIRKLAVWVEETHREQDRTIDPPTRKAVACAVIRNPLAGRYQEDLEPLMSIGEILGGLLTERAVAALGIDGGEAESYGKAAIVGADGELEHGGALIHPTFGKPMRKAVVSGKAVIPSAKKRGGPGTRIDVPLHYKDDEWRFSHFDAVEVGIADAPRADEIVVIAAITDSGRPLARIASRPKSEVGAD